MEVNKSFLLAYYNFFAEGYFYFPFLFWFIFFMIQVITEEIFMFFFSLLFGLRQSKIAYDSSCLSAPLCHTVWDAWTRPQGRRTRVRRGGTRQGRRRPRVRVASDRVVPRGKSRIGPTRLKSAPIRRKSAPTRPKSGWLGSYQPYRPVSAETAESGRNSKKKKKKKKKR